MAFRPVTPGDPIQAAVIRFHSLGALFTTGRGPAFVRGASSLDFELRCMCGQQVSVSDGAAGTTVECPCGRAIAVPSLSELRRQAGVPALRVSPALLIAHMLASGELPTVTTCAHCDSPTDQTADVTAECEKVWIRRTGGVSWVIALLLFGVWGLLLRPREGEAKEYGRNLVLHLPVRMCRSCQRQLSHDSLAASLEFVAVVLALLAGLVLFFLWTAWGWSLLAGSLLMWGEARVVRARRRRAIMSLLRREPLYEQLFTDYPDANVVLNLDDSATNKPAATSDLLDR
jgi:hypothetical protein